MYPCEQPFSKVQRSSFRPSEPVSPYVNKGLSPSAYIESGKASPKELTFISTGIGVSHSAYFNAVLYGMSMRPTASVFLYIASEAFPCFLV